MVPKETDPPTHLLLVLFQLPLPRVRHRMGGKLRKLSEGGRNHFLSQKVLGLTLSVQASLLRNLFSHLQMHIFYILHFSHFPAPPGGRDACVYSHGSEN